MIRRESNSKRTGKTHCHRSLENMQAQEGEEGVNTEERQKGQWGGTKTSYALSTRNLSGTIQVQISV